MDSDSFDELQHARHEFDQVVAEIRQVPGYADFLTVPALADILGAAGDRPLCYLTAADSDGLALIVHNGDVTPVVLPMLCATTVRERVGSHLRHYRGFQRDHRSLRTWTADVDAITQWLWDAVLGPVLDRCPADEMTIVAGGLLGLLPLHAAWFPDASTITVRRYAIDDTVISYVPNARSLAAARARAQRSSVRTLLAVADPRPCAEGMAPLDSAEHEASEVAAACEGCAPVLLTGPDATVTRVRAELSTADILHFACHGIADLGTPRGQHLVLAGQDRLTLRDLLTMDLRARLTVLSACETSMLGTELPDEALALPSAGSKDSRTRDGFGSPARPTSCRRTRHRTR